MRSKVTTRAAAMVIVVTVALAMALLQLSPDRGLGVPVAAPPEFLVGADISGLGAIENRGATFRDMGRQADLIQSMAAHGWNCFRLRLFVNPNGQGGVVNSLPYTIALARRIRAAGAAFILDIHYSDTWADPQHQVKPAAWTGLPFEELLARVRTYTADVMQQMRDAGVSPDIVQVGNEITGGMLWPDAQVQVPPSTVKVYDAQVHPVQVAQPYDEAHQWDHLARVLKAAIGGVQAATDAAHPVQILIHIDCGGDAPVTRWFCDHLQNANVNYDILGQSFYPNWHGSLANLKSNLQQTADRYHKKILIVETAYPWKFSSYWSSRKNMAWPISPAGQRQYLADLVSAVRAAPRGLGLGVIYWSPESISVHGVKSSTWEGGAMALFDDDGNALPAVDAAR
jgi:arabinogalactan endo-1,4-beta-galactosidase